MHIIYTIGSLQNPGGVERVLINKANFFVNHGYDVTIIVANKGDYNYAYQLDHQVNVLHINTNQYDNLITRIPLLGFFCKIKKLKKVYSVLIKQLKPDIIINVERGFEDFILPNISPDIKTIRECHSSQKAVQLINSESHFNKRDKFFTSLYNKQLLKYDEVVFLTEEDLIDRKFSNGRNYIPNIISKFSITPDYNLSFREVISVGRLDQFKNFKDQIYVWKKIVQKYPDWILKIYGDGSEKQNLLNLISQLGLEKNVLLMGKSLQIEDALQKSAFFLFTSLAEGFGMVIVEAMQMGLPVVSYNCPCGPKDIISDGIDGFLVDVNDKEFLEKKVSELIENTELRKQMSNNAIKKSGDYSEEIIMPQWIKLFNKLTNG